MKRIWKKPDIDNYVSSLNNLDKKPNSDRKRLLLKISQLYLEIEDYKEALVYTKQYLKLAPNDCKGYKILAATQEKLGSTKEALKSYRRSSELDPRDVESKESVARLYCQSEELLYRKKAWLDKMSKELPHSQHTETLRFTVLMEGGQTAELERHLLAHIQRDPLNIKLHKQLIKVFKKRGDLKETFHYCCSLSKGGAFYTELEWLELSLEIMAAYCKESAEISCTSGEQLIRTADWALSAQHSLQSLTNTWIMYDACLYTLSKMSHLASDRRWGQVVQEAQGRLWLHLASIAQTTHQEHALNEMNREQHRVGCLLLALTPPPLPASHPSTELSQHRLATAGLGVSVALSTHSPTWLGEVVSDYCSSQGQLKLLNTYLGTRVCVTTSFTATNPIGTVTMPEADYTPHCVQYLRLRPLELTTLLASLSQLAALSTPLALSVAVSHIFSKLPPHPLSITSLTASDVSQSDVCVLLHLLTQFPELESAKVQHFWNELCFHCKSVSVCPLLRSVATLKSGLWAIRGLSNHGLGPLQAIAMAKYFAHRAAELESDRQSVPRDKFSSRSGHYWRVAHNTIKQLLQGTYKRPKDSMFTSRQLEEVELSLLQEQTGLAVAGVLVNEGKWGEAISVYSEINTPQAAYNSAQVYMHLAELGNSPSAKSSALENSRVELALCKERALDVNDQKLVDLVEKSLSEISAQSMPFVTRRKESLKQFEDLPEQFTYLKNVTFRGQVAQTPLMPKQILNLLEDTPGGSPDTKKAADVCKQLCFSPTPASTSESISPKHRRTDRSLFSSGAEDEICAKLEDLSVNYNTIQAELGNKNSEVDLLKEQVKILKDEMELLKQNVSQYSGSPRDTPPYGTPHHPGQVDTSPHTKERQTIYHGYHSPALMNSPRMGQPPLYPGSPASGQIQIVPGYPGYPIPAYPVQSLYPGLAPQEQSLYHGLAHQEPFLAAPPEPYPGLLPTPDIHPGLLPTPDIQPGLLPTPNIHSGLLPTPEAFSGLALREALSHASMGLASSTPVRLNVKAEAPRVVEEVITPFPSDLGKPAEEAIDPATPPPCVSEAVFDPSALPAALNTSSDWGGKFSKDIPSVLVPTVLDTAPGPDYFSSLLDAKPEVEPQVELGYESPTEVDTMSCSQHFSAGAWTEPNKSSDKLQRSTSSNPAEVDTTSDFVPLVTLDEVHNLVTGEEGEEIVYEGRAKLFRFDACGEWKHRGIGEMKILVNRQTKVPRLVMRRDFVLNLCANHVITRNMTISPAMGSTKAWLWFTASDLTHDEPEPQQLAARFKTEEVANDFKEAFERCRDRDSLPPAAEATIEEIFCDGVLDEDLVITYVKEGTSEEKDTAKRWQLPETFYTNTKSCTGCIGCEEENEVMFVREVLPPTPVKQKAAQYQLPPSFYNARSSTCKGCIGCEDCEEDEENEEDEEDDIHELSEDDAPLDVTPTNEPLEDSVVITYATEGVNESLVEKYKLPQTFYNTPKIPCTGCLGCDESQHAAPALDDSVQITYETSPEDAAKAALYHLPPTFYNASPPCAGCVGCEGCNSVNQGVDDSIEVVYERPAEDPSKANYYQLPKNFFDAPLEGCEGCLGCDEAESDEGESNEDDEDEDYTSYIDVEEQEYTSHTSGYLVVDPGQEEEDYTSYGGCGRSDPNEPVSEKPLYDDLWPEDITEEDKGQFFNTKEQEGDPQETDIFSDVCDLLQHDPRCGGYKEHGSGLMTIKSHTERQQFRILFRSDEGKIHANHAIEGGMFIEPTKKTKGYVWFVPIDYSDPETPKPERFAAQFEEPGKMKEFVEMFKDCSAKMKGHAVNHKLVSLLAAGSPRKEASDKSLLETSALSGLVNTSYLSNQSVTPTVTPSKPAVVATHAVVATPAVATPVKLTMSMSPHVQPVLDPCAGLRDTFQQEFCSDDINIINEIVPSKEMQELEMRYQLPRGFYNYLTSPQCEGCLGCEEPATPKLTVAAPPITTPLSATTFGLANTTPTAFGLNPTTPNFGLSDTNSLYGALPQMDPSNQYNANSPTTPNFGLMNIHPSRTETPPSRNLFGSPQQNLFGKSNSNIFAQSNIPTFGVTTSAAAPLFASPAAQTNPFSGPYVPPAAVGDPADYEDYGDYSSDSDEDYEGYYEEEYNANVPEE